MVDEIGVQVKAVEDVESEEAEVRKVILQCLRSRLTCSF